MPASKFPPSQISGATNLESQLAIRNSEQNESERGPKYRSRGEHQVDFGEILAAGSRLAWVGPRSLWAGRDPLPTSNFGTWA